jgi:hypothetical protein
MNATVDTGRPDDRNSFTVSAGAATGGAALVGQSSHAASVTAPGVQGERLAPDDA